MECLDRSAFFHEPICQIIQQCRVAGRLAAHSQLIRVFRQSFPKMPGPNAVDDHTGHEGIALMTDPPCQRQPSWTLPRGER